jgi:hypothetical protein
VSFLSTAVQQVLSEAPFCAVATSTPDGPHCTPLVFAYSGGRVWLTTSRGSVKARVWKRDPSVAGLVRSGGLAVSFAGTVKTYDALDRETWADAVAGATSIARATATFSRKNARFFAGYAFDARQIPLAWTPPGRVFVGIDLARTALLDDEGVQEGRGRWEREVGSHRTFRRSFKEPDPFQLVPSDVVGDVGRQGEGALAMVGALGPVVLPVRWRAEEHALFAALPIETLALSGADSSAQVALTVDSPSIWRARDMVGIMVQGPAAVYELDALGSGAKTARELATSMLAGAGALVRISPERLVWWKGWTSGSVRVQAGS